MVLETANKGRLTAPERRASGASEPVVKERPLEYLASLTTAVIDDLVELVISYAHQLAGTAEIVAASERFFVENGKVFHDDTFYDPRMTYFFDHFVFERPLTGGRTGPLATPYEHFLAAIRDQGTTVAPAVMELLNVLRDYRHSLFQIIKLENHRLVLADLLVPGRLTVTARPGESFRGLEKKNIFQGFVFANGDIAQMSPGIILHPQRAARLIKRFLKQSQKVENFSRKITLTRLASLQLRYLRHRHVDPKAIYLAELKAP